MQVKVKKHFFNPIPPSDIAMLLRRIPCREEFTDSAALAFVTKPKQCEVEFPFGSIATSAPVSSDEEEPEPDHNSKRRKTVRSDSAEPGTLPTPSNSKYNSSNFSNMRGKFPNNIKYLLPDNMKTVFWQDKYLELSSLAVASSSWKSRLSSLNKLKAFASDTQSKISWPLNKEFRNGFIVWCYDRGNVTANTVKKYLVHLNSIQSFLGFKKFNNKNKLTSTLLNGFKNSKCNIKKKPVTRKAITFDVLKTIRSKLKKAFTVKHTFQTFWTACCVAFFGCFRLGEILPKNSHVFDPSSDLTWKDIKIHKKSVSIIIKSPKTTPNFSDKVYLFNFKIKKFCPVRNLKKLKRVLSKQNIFSSSSPVFRLDSKNFLTQKVINKFLKSNFKNVFIRGHSFRAGIPTSIANFPDISNDSHVMGWGRWRSKAFSSYQKSPKKQKRWVFKKIEKALLQS